MMYNVHVYNVMYAEFTFYDDFLSLPPSLSPFLSLSAAVARLMSEEVLDSESDQISETGSHSGNKKKPSTPG
jgi:hypothetical protein